MALPWMMKRAGKMAQIMQSCLCLTVEYTHLGVGVREAREARIQADLRGVAVMSSPCACTNTNTQIESEVYARDACKGKKNARE